MKFGDYLGCGSFQQDQGLAEGLLCITGAQVRQGSVSLLHQKLQLSTDVCSVVRHLLLLTGAKTATGQRFRPANPEMCVRINDEQGG